MPAISFSGITSRGPFYELILNEEKMQTIRGPRVHPVKAEDELHLWWKQRLDKKYWDKTPIRLIAYATCIEVERVYLADIWRDKENALADGFQSLNEFQEWFVGYPAYQELDIIKWDDVRNKQEVRT